MNYDELKQLVLRHYTKGRIPKCAKCGERKDLQIDHINNNGKQERKKHGNGANFYRYLIKNNYPKGYRVLCRKCNVLEAIKYHNMCLKSLSSLLTIRHSTNGRK